MLQTTEDGGSPTVWEPRLKSGCCCLLLGGMDESWLGTKKTYHLLETRHFFESMMIRTSRERWEMFYGFLVRIDHLNRWQVYVFLKALLSHYVLNKAQVCSTWMRVRIKDLEVDDKMRRYNPL